MFRDILAEVVETTSAPRSTAAVEEVTPAVEAYLASAAADRRRSPGGPAAAKAAYPRFVADFAALEEELPPLGTR